MNNISEEQSKKLLKAENSAQLCEIAKEIGVEIDSKNADEIFAELKTAEKLSSKIKALSPSDQNKLDSLLSDSKDETDVKNAFKSFDIEISEKVIQRILKAKEEGVELSDEELDNVAGGGFVIALSCFAISTLVGYFMS